MSMLNTGVPKALIEELEKRYPRRPYTSKDTHPDIMHREGQLSVVEYIRASYEVQQETVFKTPIKITKE